MVNYKICLKNNIVLLSITYNINFIGLFSILFVTIMDCFIDKINTHNRLTTINNAYKCTNDKIKYACTYVYIRLFQFTKSTAVSNEIHSHNDFFNTKL